MVVQIHVSISIFEQGEWLKNKESLLSFLEAAPSAVHGLVTKSDSGQFGKQFQVTDSAGQVVNDAVLETKDLAKDLYTSARGIALSFSEANHF